jgi:hypothetical protein
MFTRWLTVRIRSSSMKLKYCRFDVYRNSIKRIIVHRDADLTISTSRKPQVSDDRIRRCAWCGTSTYLRTTFQVRSVCLTRFPTSLLLVFSSIGMYCWLRSTNCWLLLRGEIFFIISVSYSGLQVLDVVLCTDKN